MARGSWLAVCMGVAGLLLLAIGDETTAASSDSYFAGTLTWAHHTGAVFSHDADREADTRAELVHVQGLISFDRGCSAQVGDLEPGGSLVLGGAVHGELMSGPVGGPHQAHAYFLEVVHVDNTMPGHCRWTGRLTNPWGGPVLVPLEPTEDTEILWTGAYGVPRTSVPEHVNNPTLIPHLRLLVPLGVFAGAAYVFDNPPAVEFPTLGLGHTMDPYGVRHCPLDTVCKFTVTATDPEGDPLVWREALPAETGDAAYQQPGPLGTSLSVTPGGTVSWDTTGADPGDMFSTYLIVSDGSNEVPVELMLEVEPSNKDPCWVRAEGEQELEGEYQDTDDLTPAQGGTVCCDEQPDHEFCVCPPARGGATCACPPHEHCPIPVPPEGKEYEHHFWPSPGRTVQVKPSVSLERTAGHGHLDHHGEGGGDADGDGIQDADDLCPGTATTANGDADGDGLGDGCDPDADNDGLLDGQDACPLDPRADCGGASVAEPDVEAGRTAPVGFFAPSWMVERSSPRLAVQEADTEAASASPLFVLLAVMACMLLLAARRRRQD